MGKGSEMKQLKAENRALIKEVHRLMRRVKRLEYQRDDALEALRGLRKAIREADRLTK